MSIIETYERWLHIGISHEYYNSGNTPLTLTPTDNCRLVLKKNGILLRKDGLCRWVILRLTGEVSRKHYEMLAEEVKILRFELSPSAEDFFYLTSADDIAIDNDNCTIEKTDAPGVWRILEVPINSIILHKEPITTQIDIKCRRKLLRFILIAKYNHANITLRLNEEKDRIIFGNIENFILRDGTQAYSFTSSDTFALQEITPYRIQLWEVRKTGERLLYGNVPLPRYDEISTIGSNETITTYFYY